MFSTLSIDSFSKSEKIDPNSILRVLTLKLMMNPSEIKTNNPNFPQKQIAKELACSDSTIKICTNDINMNSPYNRKSTKKPPKHSY